MRFNMENLVEDSLPLPYGSSCAFFLSCASIFIYIIVPVVKYRAADNSQTLLD